MKWVRLWVDEIIRGTTFSELTLSERGLWWSLILLAGDSLTPGIVECRKGEAYSLKHLSLVLNCDVRALKNALEKLVSVNKVVLINDESGSKNAHENGLSGSKNVSTLAKRIAIVNWGKYQTRYEKYYKNKNDEGKKDADNNGIDMPGRLEEDKKKIYKEIACRCLDYLKEVSNRRFTHTDRNLNYLIARLDEKHTEEDLKAVVDVKWKDPDFDRKYYRPSTLFNSDKFEGYLMESKEDAKPKRFDEEDF